ncbi:MAG: carbohydrate ABC transporter permease [Alphaproteobacteria bacterium]
MTRQHPLPLLILIYGFAALWVVVAAFPFVWTAWGSLKIETDFFGHWTKNISGVDTLRTFESYFTTLGYDSAFSAKKQFGQAVGNTMIITICTVVISLTFGTLGGYALARSTARYAFVLLIIALVFRAMPHITLVSGYMEPLFRWGIWGETWVAVIVLVAINQPFTIWMMRSFFMNVPRELDESAMIDGCNRLQGFWHVIMPVMWPGVITTGLFSFLLAYNDFTVTSALLSQQNTTMIPRIAGFLGSAQNDGDQMAAVAAVVTATAPLFVLIMIFQRQLVSGLTAGAVKG